MVRSFQTGARRDPPKRSVTVTLSPDTTKVGGARSKRKIGQNMSDLMGTHHSAGQQGAPDLQNGHDDKRDGRRRLGMVARVECAQRLAIARAGSQPVPWETLAEQEDLSERQCRRIHGDYVNEGLRLGDPMNLVGQTLSLLERSVTLLGDIAEGDAHDSVRIGALRLLTETLGARISLMVGAGLMPRRISQQRDHDDAVTLVRRMAEVIQRRDLDPEVIDELLAVVDGTGLELAATPR